MEQGPILIGGISRSGKTMMRFLLTSHPNIACSRRTNMWTQVYRRYGDLDRDENLARCLAAMLNSKHIAMLRPDVARIRTEFSAGPATYARLFALFHAHYAQQESKTRWGDQTALIEAHADAIIAAYPRARMIHMIRDPRDCYAATVMRRQKRADYVGDMAAMWRYSASLATRNLARYQDNYRVVRYETLVTEPDAAMQAICAFVGERYTPDMLLLDQIPRYRGVAARTGQSPITDEYVGCYRTTLAPRELVFMQAVVGSQMTAFGYTPALANLPRMDRIALSGWTGPRYLTRMLLWRLRYSLRGRLPVGLRQRARAGAGKQSGPRHKKPHATI